MKNIFEDPDLLQNLTAGELSPLKFFVDPQPKFPEVTNNFFGFSGDNHHQREALNECYGKHGSYFSEMGNVNNDYSESLFEEITKDDSKSSALSKVALIDQMPSSTEVDQTSIKSLVSNEASVLIQETKNKSNFYNSKNLASERLNQNEHHKAESIPTGEINEGDLVFLVRKVNRKTKKSVLLTKHRKRITKCPHKTLEYYAKGMCKNCYHNKGQRSKKASKCDHSERDHYAKGLCKNCYLHFFHIKKKERKASAATNSTSTF